MWNTETLQLFKKKIKTENIYKNYLKFQAKRLGWRDLVFKLKEAEALAL